MLSSQEDLVARAGGVAELEPLPRNNEVLGLISIRERWYTPVISVLRKGRQEDQKSQVILGYMGSSRPVSNTVCWGNSILMYKFEGRHISVSQNRTGVSCTPGKGMTVVPLNSVLLRSVREGASWREVEA